MARYVDGYLLPIPKKHLATYKKIASGAGRIWREHGALQYVECAGDDLAAKGVASFPRMLKGKPAETVVFAFVVYKSRAHRDRVNKKVMNDPRITAMGEGMPEALKGMMKRMVYGGFAAIVDL